MAYSWDGLAERERRRWMKPNAHLYMRPDAERFIRHDASRFIGPDAKGWQSPDEKLWDQCFRHRGLNDDGPQVSAPCPLQSRAGTAAAAGDTARTTREILRLKSDLAALRVQFAVIRHEIATRKARGLPPLRKSDECWQILLRGLARFQEAFRKAGFIPDQPRVPAGNPDGGQWTDSGGSGSGINDAWVLSDATPDNEWIPGARYAQNEIQKQYSVDLNEEECHGGHTLRDHVGRSDSELLARMHIDRGQAGIYRYARQRQGSFESREAANDFVNRTLEQNKEAVDGVTTGKQPRAFLEARFGYRTGREAYRESIDAEPILRDTYEVGVEIRHDPRVRRGYRVHTAYPRNSARR